MTQNYRISINRIALIEKPDDQFPWSTYMQRFEAEDLEPLEFLDRIGKGFGFAPVFGGDGRPTIANFLSAQYIAVDMDTEDARSAMGTLMWHPLVSAHGAIIYPTHSHTDDKPRHRVVFLLDEPIDRADHYRMACTAVTALFDGADPSGCNPNKTWMANGKIGADNLWSWVHYGPPFALSRQDLRLYVHQHQARQPQRQQPAQVPSRPYRSGERMDLNELFARLSRIDSYSLSYDDWVRLGAAVAHSYGDPAFILFKQWSDQPGKTPLTRSKWHSLAQDAAGGKSAGYGTLIHLLKERSAL